MQLEVLTPDSILFQGEVTSVSLPGVKGRFQILNNHAALVSSLSKGELIIETKDNQIEKFEINGGILEILNNKAVVLA